MVQNFSSFLFKRNHLCLNLRHQGGYHPCHHVTWEWGVVRLFEPFLLQLRREAFDFRFRKAHHRTFDGLTVAEACRGGGRERFGSQNVNSYVKIPKMFWVFHLFFWCFLLNWTSFRNHQIWLSWCFSRFFFPTSSWQPNLLAICGLFCWFLLGQEGIWQGDFSFVQLADPQSLGQSFSALLLENRGFKPSITITKTFLNESWILPIPVSMCFIFPLGLFLSSGWVCFMGTSLGKRRYVWSCPVLELWCRCNRSAGKGDVEQRAEFSKFGLVRAKYGWAMESQVTLYCCIQLYIDW